MGKLAIRFTNITFREILLISRNPAESRAVSCRLLAAQHNLEIVKREAEIRARESSLLRLPTSDLVRLRAAMQLVIWSQRWVSGFITFQGVLSLVPLRRRRVTSRPPGHRLLAMAEVLFSPKTVALTFRPLVADWRTEIYDALNAERPLWHLRLISVRYYWYFAKAAGLNKIGKLFKTLADISSIARQP
jgi:hypothetical protein